MKVFIAKSAGFCFGVKRGMEMALEAAKRYPKDLYTLGPLIHNPQAVEYLEQLGIKVKERVKDIPRGMVILRSHGVSCEELRQAREKRLRIIDATCPIVKRAQFYAKFLTKHGYSLLIVGEAHHPEVEAIRSSQGNRVEVVEDIETIKKLGPWNKLGVIAQTTQSFTLFKDIVATCMDKTREIRVFNTICYATTLRQKEAVEIAKRVDCMIVVGGYNSGNTVRLASICKQIQPNTHHIEIARELRPKWFLRKERVGLTAGASTPSWIIQDVEEKIRNINRR